jgi:hypothetical protein
MFKIIGADQKEYGPITADQLRQWIAEGRVNAQTKVQPEGATEWKTMADLPEFAAVLPRPAPPLPPSHLAAPPTPAGTNPMAVWSMVTGIASVFLCCLGFVGIVSIILGAVALSQLKQNPQQSGRGFAIAGIVLGAMAVLLFVIFLIVTISSPQWMQNFPNALQQ